MASAIDICNSALSEIGSRTSISGFNDGTVEGYNCGLFYDAMRKKLLRSAPWGFSRKTDQLTLLFDATSGNVPFPWMFEYLYPANCMKVRYQLVVPPGWPFPTTSGGPPAVGDPWFPNYPASRRYRFMIENDLDPVSKTQRKVILSQVQNSLIVYSIDVTDVNMFDEAFKDALISLLAYKLVIPITGNVGMKKDFFMLAKTAVDEAKAIDGNESMSSTKHTPDWIKARGWAGDLYYSGWPQFGFGIWGEAWDNLSWGD